MKLNRTHTEYTDDGLAQLVPTKTSDESRKVGKTVPCKCLVEREREREGGGGGGGREGESERGFLTK